MTVLLFEVGVMRAPRVQTPPGVPPHPHQWQKLAEQKIELGEAELEELKQGYAQITFPVRALQGRAGAEDAISIRIGLPGHNLIEGDNGATEDSH